jgi:acyl-CoA reductase-like NAD-dependent aldehyde dehydrogenase
MELHQHTPSPWAEEARALRPDGRPWIGGRRVEAVASGSFTSTNPANGTLVAELPACGAADIDAAVRAARDTFERGVWSGLSPRDRAQRLHAFAEAIGRHGRELALLDSLEMGMPIANALADMQAVVEQVHATAEAVDKLVDGVIPNDSSALVLNLREPHGVVGAITPWNFPAYIAIGKIAPAIAVGNSIVVKPSEIASLSSLRLGEIAAEAGIPDGVINVVPGLGADAGAALALHMDVDFLTFTGSTATGKRLLQLAGQSNMKRLALECGGKSPQVVFGDVENLDALAGAIVDGITFNSGQVCVAGSRLLVARSLHDALVERVVARAAIVRASDPLDESTTFGPLASADQHARVRHYVESGSADGAALVLDGAAPPALRGGCYWLPTVFTGVRATMRIAQEEIFGPVLATLPFDSEDEAVALANATIYGLVATVWTRDLSRALRLARRIRAGAVTVAAGPGGGRVDATAGAFEPHGQSGFGIEGGLEGLRSYTRLKAITLHAGTGRTA